jgi:5'(3')-deoxyribonucleotidase
VPKIGLDVDEVLAAFVPAYCSRYNLPIPHCWNFDPLFSEHMEELKQDKSFWLNIKPLIKPEDLPFEPAAYITSRVIPNEWTQAWLNLHRFPVAPVITTTSGFNKAEHIKELQLDYFVDDNMEIFAELTRQGICCFLMDAEHNRRYDVGYKRIKNLHELAERW